MMEKLLAALRGVRPLTDRINRLQDVQQDTGVVATRMAEHIESGAEQLVKRNRLDNHTKLAIRI